MTGWYGVVNVWDLDGAMAWTGYTWAHMVFHVNMHEDEAFVISG